MRNRSIVGPLILILIGVLFLFRNLIPDLSYWTMFWDYWPFLLIAIGVLRLIEIVFAYSRGAAYPPRGGSLGALIAVVVVVTIFWSISRHVPPVTAISHRWRTVDMFGESYDYPEQGSLPATGVQRVVFDVRRGNLRITGSDSQEVQVTGTKTIRALGRDEADKANHSTGIKLERQGDRILVHTDQDRLGSNLTASEELHVTLPKSVLVEARMVYGDVDASDVAGVEISSGNAGVRLNNIAGDTRIDLKRSDVIRAVNVKGNVDLQGGGNDIVLENVEGQVTIDGSYGGTLEMKNLTKPVRVINRNTQLNLQALPGRIVMDLSSINGNKLVGPVRLVTKSRDIRITDVTESLEVEADRGDIELQFGKSPLPRVDARSKSGNIELQLPDKSKFTLDASTSRGEAHNEYGDGIQSSSDGRAAYLKGSVGQGPTIRVGTQHGTISVKKAGVAATNEARM